MTITRRAALRLGAAAGAAGLTGLGLSGPAHADLDDPPTTATSALLPRNTPRPYAALFKRPPVVEPYDRGEDDVGRYARYELTQQVGAQLIVPRLATLVAGYNGVFPGPTIKANQGERVEVRQRNALHASPWHGGRFSTSTHLHGSASLPQYDGYASDLTQPGYEKNYHYPNWQPARTLWYHDHNIMVTAQNVFAGLAGLYPISDQYERAQLPQGEFDVPLIISDASFNADGSFNYDDNLHRGLYGDVILVNGVPWPTMRVKPRVYRFRTLVASLSRSYRPALSTGEPLHLVATDAGLVPQVQSLSSFRTGAAERYEVLIDFRHYRPGQVVELLNRSNKNNENFTDTDKIMRFVVEGGSGPADGYRIPDRLDRGPEPFADLGALDVMSLDESQATAVRKIRVQRNSGMWTLNGETWDQVVRSGFQRSFADPARDAVEIWELENLSGGWFHPLHVHLTDGRIIGRNTTPDGKPFAWERGPKDVYYLGEAETVRVIMQFNLGPRNAGGRYMVHCHNLVHEDHDMMMQFNVGKVPDGVNHPISAAPPVFDLLPYTRPRYAAPYPLGT